MIERYHLGCPMWSNREWVGLLFARDARSADFLRQYATVFNAVEGNTTFYGVPAPDTVARWRDETPAGFHFCFKFPRAISHERLLVDAEAETEAFLAVVSALGDRLGPIFLQLPPSFGPDSFDVLARFLDALPSGLPYAVEVRHRGFFQGEAEAVLNAFLGEREIDRVLYDTRGLRASGARDPILREAVRQKPDVPVRFVATGRRPFVRYIAHPEPVANRQLFAQWADLMTAWIAEGRIPHVFVHAPDDRYAPFLARVLHDALARRANVGTMPQWPGEAHPDGARQLELFD